MNKLEAIKKYWDPKYRHFATVADFAAAAVPVARKMGRGSDSWAGGSVDDAARYCEHGDVGAVAHASEIADMINDSVDIAGRVDCWSLDVAGAFPCVPAFLGGDPACMWSRSDDSSSRGVIDVWFDLGVSWQNTADQMRRRGVCVLALLLALQRVRNVRAHFYSAMIGGNFTMDFSYPFDVSELAAFCGQPVITRRLAYGLCENEAANKPKIIRSRFASVAWAPWSERYTHDYKTEVEELKKYAGLDGDSLVVTSGKIGDLAGMSDNDFIASLNGIISKVNDGIYTL